MITKRTNTGANAENVLVMSQDAGVCCGDGYGADYVTAETDVTMTTLEDVRIKDGDAAEETIAIPGSLDWTDPANDEAVIEAISTVATDKGYEHFDGGITLTRGAADTDLTIAIRDSGLKFIWIGETTNNEIAFVETALP